MRSNIASEKILRLAALAQDDILRGRKAGHPGWGAHGYRLAAAAVIVAATTAAVVIGNHTVIATAAEQNQQDDDPAPVTATKTVITHKKYLRKFFRSAMPLIPRYSSA